MADERTYVVPLRRGFVTKPRYKRTKHAVSTVREFVVKHMKAADENVRLGQHLNDFLWSQGIRNPPPRVKITVSRNAEGIVLAELHGKDYTDVVRPQEKKEQAQTLKEKLQSAVGKKGEKTSDEEAKTQEPKAEEHAHAHDHKHDHAHDHTHDHKPKSA